MGQPTAGGEFSDEVVDAIVARCKKGSYKCLLCKFFCACINRGNQACVESALYSLDAASGGTSPLLAEIPYNTMVRPPRAMLSTQDGRKGSRNWRFPNNPNYPEGYQRGAGDVVRPDVVIMNDGAGVPQGTNLAAVAEMKFPNDPNGWDSSNMQLRERQYRRIAQENNPDAEYIRIDKDICEKSCGKCGEEKTRPQTVPEVAPAPSIRWDRVFDGLSATAEILGGAALTVVSAGTAVVLVADDAAGIVIDDVALPLAVGGMTAGTAMVGHGSSRLLRAFGF
ncbi:hypothetical protein F0U62_15270 [Cystobacter fuscus]|uniref:hypothetical protein n=1 Tax=Cystobacter fuscus TaxID=43 RepID=UPI002B282B58|nr:hypothetical protein F0U62_15270 [Cystobacter fuscus]